MNNSKSATSAVLAGLFMSVGLTACGGGGGGATTSAITETVSGQFIDAAVGGLTYTCSSGGGGMTDQNGAYTCNKNDTVTFSINGFVIGSAAISELITPNTLATDTAQALNIAQLLQTLDSDNDPSNGISIAQVGPQFDALATMATDNVTLAQADFDSVVSLYLGEILVDETTAQTHLDSSINSLTFDAATIKAALAGQTLYPSKATPKHTEEWNISADGLSASGSGVDDWGAYSGTLNFSYTDTSFTVTVPGGEEPPVTFQVLAITNTYIQTTIGKIYHTQAEAHTDAIIAAVAGKKLYRQQLTTASSEEWAFDPSGASMTVNGVDDVGPWTDHVTVTYSGNTFTILNQDVGSEMYNQPLTFTVTDILPHDGSTATEIHVKTDTDPGFALYYSQQEAYVGSNVDSEAIIATFAGKKLYPQQPSLAYSQEWALDATGANAVVTGVDASGPFTDHVTVTYSGSTFTATNQDVGDDDYGIPRTFTVLTISPTEIRVRDASNNEFGVFYSQQEAYVGL